MLSKSSFNRSIRRSFLTACSAVGLVIAGASAHAQNVQGNSAIWGPSTAAIGSGTYIDASQFTGSTDLCVLINDALNQAHTAGLSGVVIDARGINPGQSNTCAASPWHGFNGTTKPPGSVILLPSGTITASATWYLPNATRIVGEGMGVTTLAAASGLGTFIQMGDSTFCPAGSPCQGVAIEELTLDGTSGLNAAQGIINQYSQEHSYVRDVAMTNITNTGLTVDGNEGTGGNGGNSGPYENLYIIQGTGTNALFKCAEFGYYGTLGGPTGTRGLHGLTCIGNGFGTNTTAGISLNSSNTTFENITVSGFPVGIIIGNSANFTWPVKGDVLINIQAASGAGTMKDLIYIANAGNCTVSGGSACSPNSNCQSGNFIAGCLSTNTMDIEFFAISNNGVATNTLLDNQSGATNTTITGTAEPYIAMYVLGPPMNDGSLVGSTTVPLVTNQNSHFTTAANFDGVPSWVNGALSSSITGVTCSSPGSFFSNTNGTGSGANNLFACVSTSSSANSWEDIY